MVRWLMSIIGVGLLVFSFLGKRVHPPLPETPESLSVQASMALTQDDDYHYVTIDAGVDADQKIYNTVLHRPIYSRRDTGECYDVTEALDTLSQDLPSYLGCIVSARIPSIDDLVSLRTVSKKTGEKDKVLKERLLVPLAGTQNRVWVLSEVFRQDNKGQAPWLDQTGYTGVLTLMKDINKNVPYPALEQSWNEIRRFIRKTFNITVDDSTYLLVTDYNRDFKPYTIMPVQGTEESVFVLVHQGREDQVAESVTGIFKAWDLKIYDEFPAVLGKDIPPRVGMIDLMSAKDYNLKHATWTRDYMIIGGGLIGLGLPFHLFARLRRKKRPSRKKRSAPYGRGQALPAT